MNNFCFLGWCAPCCVQVLHIRGFSGVGLSFVMLLAACFSLFSVECRSLTVALAMVPDVRLLRAFHAKGSQPPGKTRWGTLLCFPQQANGLASEGGSKLSYMHVVSICAGTLERLSDVMGCTCSGL